MDIVSRMVVGFNPDVVYVVFDTSNDTPLMACFIKEEAESLAALSDNTWVQAYPVPLVKPCGEYLFAEKEEE